MIGLIVLFMNDIQTAMAKVQDEQIQMERRGEAPYWHMAAWNLLRGWWKSKFHHHHQRGWQRAARMAKGAARIAKGSADGNGPYHALQEEDVETGALASPGGRRREEGSSVDQSFPGRVRKPRPSRRKGASMEDEDEDGGSDSSSSGSEDEEKSFSLENIKKELRHVTDLVEELEVRVRSQQRLKTEAAEELRAKLKKLQAKRAEIKADVEVADQTSAEQQAAELAKQNEAKKPS